jgi:hypothetical protein
MTTLKVGEKNEELVRIQPRNQVDVAILLQLNIYTSFLSSSPMAGKLRNVSVVLL